MQDKTLYLDEITITATENGIKCLEDASSEDEICGDFELAFERPKGGMRIFFIFISGDRSADDIKQISRRYSDC
jgi:hypothetical protein